MLQTIYLKVQIGKTRKVEVKVHLVVKMDENNCLNPWRRLGADKNNDIEIETVTCTDSHLIHGSGGTSNHLTFVKKSSFKYSILIYVKIKFCLFCTLYIKSIFCVSELYKRILMNILEDVKYFHKVETIS